MGAFYNSNDELSFVNGLQQYLSKTIVEHFGIYQPPDAFTVLFDASRMSVTIHGLQLGTIDLGADPDPDQTGEQVLASVPDIKAMLVSLKVDALTTALQQQQPRITEYLVKAGLNQTFATQVEVGVDTLDNEGIGLMLDESEDRGYPIIVLKLFGPDEFYFFLRLDVDNTDKPFDVDDLQAELNEYVAEWKS